MIVIKKKKIIDESLHAMLERDEIGTVKMLYDVLHKIYVKYGDVTDDAVRQYNEDEDGEYEIKKCISTIRNYLKPYRYVIKKDDACIFREMTVDEYAATVPIASKNDNENKGDNFMDNLTVKQKLSLAYADKSEQYNDLKLMSLRCSKDVLDRFHQLSLKYKCFDKSYLLSYILEAGMDAVGYKPEENNEKTSEL